MAAADRLADRIDALAAALVAAGVDPDRVASLLGIAATATMNALVLEAISEQDAEPEPLRVAA